MKVISFLILGLLLYFSPINLPKGVVKKMDQAIHSIWIDENITYQKLDIPISRLDSLGFELQENQLFIVMNESSILGYVYLDQGMGRYDYFDYMVITDTDIVVKLVQVLIYRSENGGAICNKRWLQQFIDQSPHTTFNYGNEIDAVSGATLSGNSITEGVVNALSQLNRLKQSEILN